MYFARLLIFLARLARGVPLSRSILALVIVTSVGAGLVNTGLVAFANLLVSGDKLPDRAGLIYLALCVTLPVFRFSSRALLVRLTQSSLNEFRLQMCRRILSTPLLQVEQLGVTRLQTALVNDLVRITDALGIVPEVLLHFVVIVSCLIYLGTLSPVALIALLALMVFGIVTYQLPMVRALRYQARARDQWDEVFEDIRGVTQGAKELKMNRRRREEFLRDQLGVSTEALRRYSVRASILFTAATSWGHVLFFAVIGVLLFLAPARLSFDHHALAGFVLVIVFMMSPLEAILGMLPQIGNAQVSVKNIESLGLSLAAQSVETMAPERPQEAWRSIELQGVTHTYRREGEEDNFLLGPIDLVLRPGEIVFLIGGNGSGKTTLAKLLLGLYLPEGGEIRVDGEPLDGANRDRYRQLFSVVFADFFLFRKLAGLTAEDLDAQATRYLRELRLDKKVRVSGGELSSLDLSQGQRKRLALLTAYLEDRPIYLFDEWASDQDPVFKEVFYREILRELKARGKTVIAISHDDRYYGVADRIIKLTDGNVELDGPAVAYAATGQSKPARSGPEIAGAPLG